MMDTAEHFLHPHSAIRDAGLASQSKVYENIPSDAESSSSSSSNESGGDSAIKKRLPLQESGRRGQLFNRLARRGDEEATSLKDEVRNNISRLQNKFRTDTDKTKGVETEV
jgi:hypothetical protein